MQATRSPLCPYCQNTETNFIYNNENISIYYRACICNCAIICL
jgi:hypothetical protein